MKRVVMKMFTILTHTSELHLWSEKRICFYLVFFSMERKFFFWSFFFSDSSPALFLTEYSFIFLTEYSFILLIRMLRVLLC